MNEWRFRSYQIATESYTRLVALTKTVELLPVYLFVINIDSDISQKRQHFE